MHFTSTPLLQVRALLGAEFAAVARKIDLNGAGLLPKGAARETEREAVMCTLRARFLPLKLLFLGVAASGDEAKAANPAAASVPRDCCALHTVTHTEWSRFVEGRCLGGKLNRGVADVIFTRANWERDAGAPRPHARSPCAHATLPTRV